MTEVKTTEEKNSINNEKNTYHVQEKVTAS